MTKEEIIEMACQAFAGIIKKEERDNFINFAKLVAEKSEQEQDEPMAWIFEDELPKNYPYEEMFPYSKVDVVRMFPIFGPSSKKEQASSNNEVLLQYPKDDVEWQKQQMEHTQQLNAEALKQEQDEPVAYINVEQRKLEWAKYTSWETPTVANLPKIPLYTTPQGCAECGIGGGYALYCLPCVEKFVGTKEWVSLTNEQIVDLVIKHAGFPTKLAEAIEAKLKQKNNIGVND